LLLPVAHAEPIETNEVILSSAPAWVTGSRVDQVVGKIQALLEWDIRKVRVSWYTDEGAFEAAHRLGPSVLAFSRKEDNSVHLGPRVDTTNFDPIFGHELVHVIVFQKYKNAIPKWLEEGLANELAKRGAVDYEWLARHGVEGDVHLLVHPFQFSYGGPGEHVRYHYQASQALVEMIASHCSLTDLLQLSVGKKLETYLTTLCGIKDVNASFREWIQAHAAKKGTHA
jgi:hypothetical protein